MKKNNLRKVLFIILLPLFMIPVSVFMVLEYILDGKTFRETWKKYLE